MGAQEKKKVFGAKLERLTQTGRADSIFSRPNGLLFFFEADTLTADRQYTDGYG